MTTGEVPMNAAHVCARRSAGILRIRVGLSAAAVLAVGVAFVPAHAASPLPDMASIAQVIGAPVAWQAGGTGQGIDVALVDTGVTPVPGLDAPGKLVYGPDL